MNVLTAGFPCQPFSVAGQRKGADDNRYLWPYLLRAIQEIRPDWVIGENVAGILTMVQPCQEVEVGSQSTLFGESESVFKRRQQYVVETICLDLEREGYSVQPVLIPACAVGAPHRRDRVWFIAHRNGTGLQTEGTEQPPAGTSGDNT
uniref:DNA cytosine methyltransferase n=1 Tax=Bacteroides ovatus TaxID=28116 RepID=UPI00359C2DFD